MRVINERKNLIDFILNFAQDEYSTKEDIYNLSIETIEQLQIRVKDADDLPDAHRRTAIERASNGPHLGRSENQLT